MAPTPKPAKSFSDISDALKRLHRIAENNNRPDQSEALDIIGRVTREARKLFGLTPASNASVIASNAKQTESKPLSSAADNTPAARQSVYPTPERADAQASAPIPASNHANTFTLPPVPELPPNFADLPHDEKVKLISEQVRIARLHRFVNKQYPGALPVKRALTPEQHAALEEAQADDITDE